MPGAAIGAALLLALAGCGTGGDTGGHIDTASTAAAGLTFDDKTALATGKASASFMGSAFVPGNASCKVVVQRKDAQDPTSHSTGFTCSCAVDREVLLTWTNTTTGATGTGEFSVSSGGHSMLQGCRPRYVSWRAPGVPLAHGKNVVTVAMQDGTSSGSATVTVVRY